MENSFLTGPDGTDTILPRATANLYVIKGVTLIIMIRDSLLLLGLLLAR